MTMRAQAGRSLCDTPKIKGKKLPSFAGLT